MGFFSNIAGYFRTSAPAEPQAATGPDITSPPPGFDAAKADDRFGHSSENDIGTSIDWGRAEEKLLALDDTRYRSVTSPKQSTQGVKIDDQTLDSNAVNPPKPMSLSTEIRLIRQGAPVDMKAAPVASFKDADDIAKLPPDDFAKASLAIRRDVIAKSIATTDHSPRAHSTRLLAMGMVANDIAKSTFVGPESASLDIQISKAIQQSSEGDKSSMKMLAGATQIRQKKDFDALSKDMEGKGFRLHELVSLRDHRWFHDRDYCQFSKTMKIEALTKAKTLAHATEGHRHPSASAALRQHGGLEPRGGVKMSEGHIMFATPIENNVTQDQYLSALQGRGGHLRDLGLTAVAAADIRTAPETLRAYTNKREQTKDIRATR